ncbi:hypothetical protein ANANG_G00317380, partial [Anguilla anguilla]
MDREGETERERGRERRREMWACVSLAVPGRRWRMGASGRAAVMDESAAGRSDPATRVLAPPGHRVAAQRASDTRSLTPACLCPFCPTEQRTTQQGQVYFLHTQTGVSTWHDPRVPRDLSNVNCEELGPSPGWEIRNTATGRVYFVDHNNRTTQFTDPRLSANLHLVLNSPNPNGSRSAWRARTATS